MISTLILAGVVPEEGESESQSTLEFICVVNVKFTCVVGSELVSTKAFPVVGPNCTGRPPCWSVSDSNPGGMEILSNALLLMKRVMPTRVLVLPLVGVVEFNETFPVQLPAARLAVLMLTVSVAGVELVDRLA